MNRLYGATLLMVTCFACAKKKTVAPVAVGADYYPAETGRFIIYDVDSTVYGDIPRDTTMYRYRVKEKFAETFTDNEGKPAFRLERMIKMYDPARPYDSLPWRMKEVRMVNVTTSGVQVTEGNERYTKLAFPVIENASWNGNAFNAEGAMQYAYEYVGRSESLGAKTFSHVLKVNQQQQRTLISYDERYEKYAEGVGLAQRVMTSLRSNSIVPGVPVEKRIETGFTYTQTIIDYGTE